MNYILAYESYKWTSNSVTLPLKFGEEVYYYFSNKNGIEFQVEFVGKEGYWTREYRKLTGNPFSVLDKVDIWEILETITDITIEFIKDYKPVQIKITHIPNTKEMKTGGFSYWKSKTTKRALINKRFLEKKIPKDYSYQLIGSTSFIKKN